MDDLPFAPGPLPIFTNSNARVLHIRNCGKGVVRDTVLGFQRCPSMAGGEGMRAAVLALALVWSACPQPAAGCDFPLFTSAAGRAIPDAFVWVTATPRLGGPEVERGLFLAKVSSFGPCPPKKADAVPLPVRLANPSGAILLLPPTVSFPQHALAETPVDAACNAVM